MKRPKNPRNGRRGLSQLSLMIGAVILLGVGTLIGMALRERISTPSAARAREEAVIAGLIEIYFQSWSSRDFKSYADCFHPNARIWYEGREPLALSPFLQTQERAHATSPLPMRERAVNLGITVKDGLASVWVRWELERGKERKGGWDFFTLIREEGRWSILSLVFNEDAP